jgi:hypothetical protein
MFSAYLLLFFRLVETLAESEMLLLVADQQWRRSQRGYIEKKHLKSIVTPEVFKIISKLSVSFKTYE